MTLRLNGSTSGYTEIEAPAVAGSNTLVLPTGNGTANYPLTTNGSGTLSWSQIQPAALSSGMVLKVQQTTAAGSNTNSTSNIAAAASNISYTPVSNNSVLYFVVTFTAFNQNLPGSNVVAYHQLSESGTGFGYSYVNYPFNSTGGLGYQGMGVIQASRTNTALTTRSFNILHSVSTSSGTCGTTSIVYTIIEVAS